MPKYYECVGYFLWCVRYLSDRFSIYCSHTPERMIDRKPARTAFTKWTLTFGTSILKDVYVHFRGISGQKQNTKYRMPTKRHLFRCWQCWSQRDTVQDATQLDSAGRLVFNTAIPKSSFIKAGNGHRCPSILGLNVGIYMMIQVRPQSKHNGPKVPTGRFETPPFLWGRDGRDRAASKRFCWISG